MMRLPVISLDQPWASAVAYGLKPAETRDWMAPRKLWGQNLGIHATKRRPDQMILDAIADEDPRMLDYDWYSEPRGALVAVVKLNRCGRVVSIDDHHGTALIEVPGLALPEPIETDALGYYGWGRWVWQFGHIAKFDEPIEMPGRQRIWYTDI